MTALTHWFQDGGAVLLIDTLIRGFALSALAVVAVLASRGASAATRHLIWLGSIVAVLVLPALTLTVPGFEVSWMPGWEEARAGRHPGQQAHPVLAPQSKLPSQAVASSPVVSGAGLAGRPAGETSAAGARSIPSETSVSASTADGRSIALPVRAAADRLSMLGWASVVWLIGVVVALVPGLVGLVGLRYLRRGSSQIKDRATLERAEEACRYLQINRRVTLLRGERTSMPVTWGARRPVLLLPACYFEWTGERQRLVLLHELAHVKRFDWLTQMIAQFACAVHWFNPCVWLAARGMRAEREQAADDLVLLAGSRPADYANELLAIAANPVAERFFSASVPMARSSTLSRRMAAILDHERNHAAVTPFDVMTVAVCVAILMIPLSLLKAADRDLPLSPQNIPGFIEPFVPSSGEAGQPTRRFVRIVSDGISLTFEGQPVSWDDLPTRLEEVPDRATTVLELAIASDEVKVRHLTELQQRGVILANRFGFEYPSYIGIHPLASSTPARTPRVEPAPSDPLERLRVGADFASAARAGGGLRKEEIAILEEELAGDPSDFDARAAVIGYYHRHRGEDQASREAHSRHVLWLIDNRPGHPLLGTSYTQIDQHNAREPYKQGRERFLQHLAQRPDDVNLLANAAVYFQMYDKALAVQSLEKALTLEPEDPVWPERLGHQFNLMRVSSQSAGHHEEYARRAFDSFERAYTLSSDSRREQLLTTLAKGAFDAGLLEKAGDYARASLSAGDDGDLYYYGHMVLGRIALAKGEVEMAKDHLLRSAGTGGSPVLGSFGPNMSLAKELIERGETESVLEFFELCAEFWDTTQLNEWAGDVKAGRMPDFGGNLYY